MDGDGDRLPQFALAVYRRDEVSEACLLLQNRLDLDVNLLLFAAYVGTAQGLEVTGESLNTARARVDEWHLAVVRPLRSIRRRLKTGPPPAPAPATSELRRKLQELEIEAELVELTELDAVAAELRGPRVAGPAAVRAAAAMTTVARSAADRELDEDERNAVDVIATAAALVAGSRGKEYG